MPSASASYDSPGDWQTRILIVYIRFLKTQHHDV